MPRRRTTPIIESDEELAQLLHHHSGTVNAERIALLIELKRNPTAPMADCATAVGLSLRKAERLWKRYRDEGLWGVVEETMAAGSKSRTELSHFDPLQFEGEVSISTLMNMIPGVYAADTIADWATHMKQILQRILPSLSHVSFLERRPLGLIAADIDVTDTTILHTECGERVARSVRRGVKSVKRWREFFLECIENGADYSRYCSDVHGMDVLSTVPNSRTGEKEIVGCYVFFVNRRHRVFPAELRNKLEAIRPWLSEMTTMRTLRHHFVRSWPGSTDLLVSLASDAYSLTLTENQVLRLVVEGHSTKRIAFLTSVSYSTVSAHIQSILKKIGVHNRGNLLMKMLTEFSDSIDVTAFADSGGRHLKGRPVPE